MSQRKLVHKQFNSPMGLYSAQNVQETLNRELKAFGGNGIEIDEDIKANLSKSAVLKALQEDEMQNQHKSAYKRVAWPPASEHRPTVREFTPQPQQFSQSPSQGVHFNQSPNTQPQSHYYQQQPPQAQPQHQYQAHKPYAQQQHQPQPQQHHNQFNNNPSGPTTTFSNPQVHKEHVVPIVVEGAQNHGHGQVQSQYQNQSSPVAAPAATNAANGRWSHVRTPTTCRTGYVLQPNSPQQQFSASAVPQSTGSWQGQVPKNSTKRFSAQLNIQLQFNSNAAADAVKILPHLHMHQHIRVMLEL